MSLPASAAESRVILRNVRWETYKALLGTRADDPSPKLTYDRGTLEIMTLSRKHERLKKLLGRFIEVFIMEQRLRVQSSGSTTLKDQLQEKGLEPDESYYIQSEPLVRYKDDLDLTVDPPPDLAVEIDVATSSLDKLGIYAGLGVPEVWSYEDPSVSIHILESTGQYARSEASKVLPGLSATRLSEFLDKRRELDETSLMEAFRDWVREKFRAG